MTKDELSRLYYLNRQIEIDKTRLDELRAATENLTAKVTGLPHATGNPHNRESAMIAVAEQEELVRLKVKQSLIEYNRLTRWIAEIEDPLVYDIMYLRFVSGLTWLQVALRIGGDNTADSVRMAADRYIKTHCSK